MKNSLLAVSLLFSTLAYAGSSKSHPCTDMAHGARGGTCSKLLGEAITFPISTKLGFTSEGILAMFAPFLHDLTEYEVNQLKEQIAHLTPAQQRTLSLVSTLNNGWYILAGILATYLAGYEYYKNDETLSDKAKDVKVCRLMLALYAASQTVAALLARKTYDQVMQNTQPTTTNIVNAY